MLPELSCELTRNLLWIVISWAFFLLPGRISSIQRGLEGWAVSQIGSISYSPRFSAGQDFIPQHMQTSAIVLKHNKVPRPMLDLLVLPGREDFMASRSQRRGWEQKTRRLGSKKRNLKFYISPDPLKQKRIGQCHPAPRICDLFL